MNKSVEGFTLHLQTFRMYREHGFLLKYSVLPFLINTVLMMGLFISALYFGLPALNEWIHSLGDGWFYTVLSSVAGFLAVIIFLVVMVLLFLVFGNIVAAPFNDLLSEKLDAVLWPEDVDTWQSLSISRILWISTVEELKRLTYLLARWVLLLPLNLIPLIGNVIYLGLNIYYTCLALSLEYAGYCLDRRGYTFRQKKEFMKKHRFPMLGFGAGVALILTIPVLNFFLIPFAVVGGTNLGTRLLKQDAMPEDLDRNDPE